jgi:WD40 repeat protein
LGSNQLASGSSDYTIKIWDLKLMDISKNLTGHLSDVLSIASTSDGMIAASGSSDKNIKIWNLRK